MDSATQQLIQGMIDGSVQTASAQMSTITSETNVRLDSLEEKMKTIDTSSKAADVAFTTHQQNVHVADQELRAVADESQLSILTMQNTLADLMRTMEIADKDIVKLKSASDGHTTNRTTVNGTIDNLKALMDQMAARITSLVSLQPEVGGTTVADVRMQANRLEAEAVLSATKVIDIENKVKEHFSTMQVDVAAIKTELSTAVQVVQAQVSTAIATSVGGGIGGGGGGGGSGGRYTLDTDKRLESVPGLNGSEPLSHHQRMV